MVEGCVNTADKRNYGRAGADFARAGGGVFATLFDADGVKTWFFPVR